MVVVVAGALLLAGCRRPQNADRETRASGFGSESGGKIHVVATILPLADWAKQVGGDYVDVKILLPPGASPHVYEPSASDMRRVTEADVFVRVGLEMDGWAGKLAQASGETSGLQQLALGDLLAARNALPDVQHVLGSREALGHEAAEAQEKAQGGHAPGESHGRPDHHHHDEGGVNPHYWLDPTLGKASLADLTKAFSAVRPTAAEEFAANAARYSRELDALDAELSATLSGVRGRSFVAFHNAYPYLAARYGLRVGAVIEESPGKIPSDRYVREVADQLQGIGIKVVFSEPQLNPRVAHILADAIGGRMDTLDPYGLATESDRDTYVKVLQYNASKLTRAMAENHPTGGGAPLGAEVAHSDAATTTAAVATTATEGLQPPH